MAFRFVVTMTLTRTIGVVAELTTSIQLESNVLCLALLRMRE